MKRAIIILLTLVPWLAGCGGGSGGTFGPQQAPTTTLPNAAAQFRFVNAFPTLSFNSPVVITHAGDGSGRLFVAELGGLIKVLTGASSSEVFLDLSGVVLGGSERGLLGLVFDPNFSTNGFFYVYYSAATATAGQDHRSVISRFRVSATNPNRADPASETILLSFDQPMGNHNGGDLAFGPDGHLYIGSGDGGGAGDPNRFGQDTSVVLGKILRIQSDGAIPADNPLVGTAGARGEIWALGFRNPFRLSFDRATGRLWVGEVGQDQLEEVNLVVRGGNYGWSRFEGDLPFNPGTLLLSDTVLPVFQYSQTGNQSITGGLVYRGNNVPALIGTYLFADFISGRVWSLNLNGTTAVSTRELGTVPSPTDFGENEAGEVFICSLNGGIFRLEQD